MRRRGHALAKRYGKGGSFAPSRAKIQALLFPRSDWSIADALTWASVHGFNTSTHDTTATHVRVYPNGKQPKAKFAKTIPYGVGGLRAAVEWR